MGVPRELFKTVESCLISRTMGKTRIKNGKENHGTSMTKKRRKDVKDNHTFHFKVSISNGSRNEYNI